MTKYDPMTGTFSQVVKDWEREQDLLYGSVLMDSDDLCLSCDEPLEQEEFMFCRDCNDCTE